MPKTVIDFTTKKQIDELLKTHLIVVDPALKLYTYETGWNDYRIADEVGNGTNRSHVFNFRVTYYGKVKTRRPKAEPVSEAPDQTALVQDLLRRVEALEREWWGQ